MPPFCLGFPQIAIFPVSISSASASLYLSDGITVVYHHARLEGKFSAEGILCAKVWRWERALELKEVGLVEKLPSHKKDEALAGGLAQVIEHSPSKCKSLGSILSTIKRKKTHG